MLGYDAIAIGPHDLSSGLALLTKSFLDGAPWVSANLVNLEGKPLFAPWVIKKVMGSRIGILGLTGQVMPTAEYRIGDWREILPRYLPQLSPACDFIIVLSTLEMAANEAIAEAYPQIQLIVTADSKAGNVPPIRYRNTLMTQTHTQGKYLGIMNIVWPNRVVWHDTVQSEPELAAELLAASTTTVDHSSGNNIVQESTGSYTFRYRSLPSQIQESPQISKRVSELKEDIARENLKLRPGADQQSQAIPAAGVYASGDVLGSMRCEECHAQQYQQWKKTRHATALASLEKERQQYNVRCLTCHVTREMTGSQVSSLDQNLLLLPERLRNVGCESCHGAGKEHVASGGETAMPKPVTMATCVVCHTPEMDAQFDFQERLSQLGCIQ